MFEQRSLSRVWRAAAFLLTALLIAGCAARPTANYTLSEVGNIDDLRREALSLVNAERSAQGLSGLRLTGALNAAAQAHAEDMARRDYYNHLSPERGDVQDRYRAQGGAQWYIIGENIGSCRACKAPGQQLREFQALWMRSAGHRRNILDGRYQAFGFGMAAANGRIYAVQTFVGEPRAGSR